MRTCTVEIAKTKNTKWPPKSVQHQGGEHSLAGMYKNANFNLNVKRGGSELALPATGGNFDLAQLHEFMLKHRRQEPSV